MLIQKIGFNALTQKSQEEFQKLFDEYSKKIDYKLKNVELLKIHLKEYNQKGEIGDKKTKFSIHVHLSRAGKSFEAMADDWDLRRTFHKVFTKVENEIEHAFHVSDQKKSKTSKYL